jgi:hypothetical protein
LPSRCIVVGWLSLTSSTDDAGDADGDGGEDDRDAAEDDDAGPGVIDCSSDEDDAGRWREWRALASSALVLPLRRFFSPLATASSADFRNGSHSPML